VYGKRVLGEKAWQAQQAVAKSATEHSGFGPRVTGIQSEPPVAVKEPPVEEAPVEPTPPGDNVPTGEGSSVEEFPPAEEAPTTAPPKGVGEPEHSVDDVVQALEGRTSMKQLDVLIDAEFDRDEPRKDALQLLLEAEKGRREPRAAILKQLNAALNV